MTSLTAQVYLLLICEVSHEQLNANRQYDCVPAVREGDSLLQKQRLRCPDGHSECSTCNGINLLKSNIEVERLVMSCQQAHFAAKQGIGPARRSLIARLRNAEGQACTGPKMMCKILSSRQIHLRKKVISHISAST